ncbi:MAG: hypothetical protein IJC88_01090 [Oscillospiraceae bacterium]|nr:hypothetical protein [Oscillospiraceae bacterium]
MDLYRDLLAEMIKKGELDIARLQSKETIDALIEMKCYRVLLSIREILDDDTIDDPACFERIERIVSLFEQLGSNGGSRHDFG